MMHWSNFAYTWQLFGWKAGIKVAFWGWITMPFRTLRIKIAVMVMKMLRVKDYIY